jgi:hypothetical protein
VLVLLVLGVRCDLDYVIQVFFRHAVRV